MHTYWAEGQAVLVTKAEAIAKIDVPSDEALTQVLKRCGLNDQQLDLILNRQHHVLFEISTCRTRISKRASKALCALTRQLILDSINDKQGSAVLHFWALGICDDCPSATIASETQGAYRSKSRSRQPYFSSAERMPLALPDSPRLQ